MQREDELPSSILLLVHSTPILSVLLVPTVTKVIDKYGVPIDYEPDIHNLVIPVLKSVSEKSDFVFDEACLKSYETFKSYTGRLNHAAQQFVQARDAGKEWHECSSPDNDNAHSLCKVPVIVAKYAGNTELMHYIDQSTKIFQTNMHAINSARLFARLLEHSLLTGSDPVDSIQWGLHDNGIPSEEKAILELVTSKDKVHQWCVFSSQIGKVPSNPSSPYLNMAVKGSALRLFLSEGSVEAALAHPSHSEEHKAVIHSALSQEADEVNVGDINTVVSAFGLSCSLPGWSWFDCKYELVTHAHRRPPELTVHRFAERFDGGGHRCQHSRCG